MRGRLPTGVDRVCLGYVHRWGSCSQAVLISGGWRRILDYSASQALFDLLLAPPLDFNFRLVKVLLNASLPPWSSQQVSGKIGFYLGHSGIEGAGIAEWLRNTGQKPVYFVHDLIPITHPEYCRVDEKDVHSKRMRVMLQTGAGIIGNSESTLVALTDFADCNDLIMPPNIVAQLAPAYLIQGGQSPSPLSSPYFVILGTIEPRKNHLLLLNIWRELVGHLGNACPHLVVIGQRGWECENILDMLERCEVIRPFVHEVSACPDSELARYLTHARALLFPSFAEGYGLPLVEALMLGTPVVASDLPVFHEIAGDVPDFLSPIDGLGWSSAVLNYCGAPSAQRDAQLERMKRFNAPSWTSHYAQVERLLGVL